MKLPLFCLFMIAMLGVTGCEGQKPGSFSVVFDWRDEPPDPDGSHYVFARVVQAGSAGNTVTADPVAYTGEVSLDFPKVPNGKHYKVIVEIRASQDSRAREVYFGESQTFDLLSGKHVRVAVDLKLSRTPASLNANGEEGVVSVLEGVPDGSRVLVANSKVTLVLAPDSATRVVVANDPSLSIGRQERALSELEEQADGRYHWPAWDLNAGLCVTCSDGPRAVYVRFENDAKYESEVYSTQIVLDTAGPQVVGEATLSREPVFAPAIKANRVLFSARDPYTEVPTAARLFVVSDELALSPELSLVDGSGHPVREFELVEQRGNSIEFQHVFDEPLPQAGDYRFEVTWRDRVGNTAMHGLRVVLEWSVATPGGVSQADTVYRRVPWGADDTGGQPSFSVSGAVRDDGARAAGVIAYRGQQSSSGFQIGSALIAEDGRFKITQLTGGDLPQIQLLTLSEAGVRGALEPVQQHEWVASMGGKLLASDVENPHTFTSLADMPRTLLWEGIGRTEHPGSSLPTRDRQGVRSHTNGVWEQLSTGTSAAPTGRYLHAVAFDPARGKLVLFGGENYSSSLNNETWEWNGYEWSLLRPKNHPPARSQHAMAYDGARGRVVLFGGRTVNDADSAQTWEWDGTDWLLRVSEHSPPVLTGHAMTYDAARGKVVLFGGYSDAGRTSETWEWDGADWTLRTPVAHPSARSEHAMAYDGERRKVVLFGGGSEDGQTWEWDGVEWSVRDAPGPSARLGHTMSYDTKRKKVVLFGGNASGPAQLETWEWDGTSWTVHEPGQTPAAQLPAPIFDDMAYDPVRGVTVIVESRGVWEWDGSSWRDRGLAPSPSPRDAHAMAYDSGRRKIVLFGGGATTGNAAPATGTWEWDEAGWKSHTPTLEPSPRLDHAMAYHKPSGTVLLFGGGNAETWEWNGTDWSLLQPPHQPPALSGHAMAYDAARGTVLLLGAGGDTWEWDGADWHDRQPAHSPALGRVRVMTYDEARGTVVVYGGGAGGASVGCSGNSADGETWEWDGNDWHRREPTSTPSVSGGHAMVYDTARGVSFLFGGAVPSAGRRCESAEAWQWDGTDWTALNPEPRPRARFGHAMTYDESRSKALLFGGRIGTYLGDPETYRPLGDTWEWNGVSRPTHLMHVDLPSAKVARGAVLRELGVTFAVGASGEVQGTPIPGAELLAWWRGGWRVLASHDALPDSPEDLSFTTTDALEIAGFLFRDGIDVLVRPAGTNGRGFAELNTDYAEVVVRYWVPESP